LEAVKSKDGTIAKLKRERALSVPFVLPEHIKAIPVKLEVRFSAKNASRQLQISRDAKEISSLREDEQLCLLQNLTTLGNNVVKFVVRQIEKGRFSDFVGVAEEAYFRSQNFRFRGAGLETHRFGQYQDGDLRGPKLPVVSG
jgi:hypothetical protein